MKVIGLTGGIGSGKSTVSKLLKSWGARIIDTDASYHRLLKEHEGMIADLKEAFGEDIFIGNELDRQRLGSIVFRDREKLMLLNSITHPVVYEDVLRQIEEGRHDPNCFAVILDSPLLIHTHLEPLLDEIWLVTASLPVKLARIKERDHSDEEYILQKIRNQKSDEENIPFADKVIDNSGSLKELEQIVKELWSKSIEKES